MSAERKEDLTATEQLAAKPMSERPTFMGKCVLWWSDQTSNVQRYIVVTSAIITPVLLIVDLLNGRW